MKKNILLVAAMLVCLSAQAFALDNFTVFNMTQDEYTTAELPVLNIAFGYQATGLHLAITNWTWSADPSISFPLFSDVTLDDSMQLDYGTGWFTNNYNLKYGLWNVTAVGEINGQQMYSGSTSFSVVPVPEPVSSVLFLTGGALLVPFLKRRKK